MKKLLLSLGFVVGSLFNATAQWSVIASGTTADFDDIHFIDPLNGFCGGGFNYTYKTVDGGTTWTATTSQGFRDYTFVNSTQAFGASIVGQSMGKTVNGGATWTMLTPPTSNSLWGVAATSSTTAYFVGTGGVLWKTINGGTSFTVKNSGTSNLITDVIFTSATTGFIAAQSTGVRRTMDAGTTWSTVTSPAGLTTEMCFVNSSVGFVVGSSGLISKTSDGGTTWTVQTTNSTSYLQSIHFYDVNTGIAVGSAGTILYTNNGGTNWYSLTSGVTGMLTDVHMTSATTAVVVGEDGVILKNSNIFVGIEEHELAATEINVFPNPVADKLTVNSTHDIHSVEVFDITGKSVYASGKLNTKEHSADLSKLKSGNYSVSVSTSAGTATKNIIK
ncbi:MAG: YCF48-related protein [Bacteroidota bacterium]